MTEKILKLWKSTNYADRYIGLKLFNNLNRTEQLRFLKKHANRDTILFNASWTYRCDYSSEISQMPFSGYIQGRYYSYIMYANCITFDTPSEYKKWTDPKRRELIKTSEKW